MKPYTLVTGGAGFIGSHLVERLLADHQAVVVVDDLSTGALDNLRAVASHPQLRIVTSRISECPNLPQLVSEAASVYHLAASVGVELVLQSPLRTLETNVSETELLLKAAAQAQVPLLLVSSSEVYGKSEKHELSEEDDLLIGPPGNGRWAYACSKLMNEFMGLAYARERAFPVVIARLFNTVGPRQTGKYGMVLPRFIGAALRGEPLRVFGDGLQTRCFCYVPDTVEALVRLQNCSAARGQVFNVGGESEVTILELAKCVVQILESKSAIELVPYHLAYAAPCDDMRRRKPALAKLARATGFRPATPLAQMILRTAASIR
jgi:UDP-glucose 4-epimerase